MEQKNGLHAFGYNSAESDPIWMKSGTVWAKCWGLALADFGAIRAVATVWEAADIFFFCQENNAQFRRFPVG